MLSINTVDPYSEGRQNDLTEVLPMKMYPYP